MFWCFDLHVVVMCVVLSSFTWRFLDENTAFSFNHVVLFFFSFEDKIGFVSMNNFFRKSRFLSFAVWVLDLWFKLKKCMSKTVFEVHVLKKYPLTLFPWSDPLLPRKLSVSTPLIFRWKEVAEEKADLSHFIFRYYLLQNFYQVFSNDFIKSGWHVDARYMHLGLFFLNFCN